jgi:predicted RNase H-like nuclease (RuvC/YqgF family)
MKQDARERRIGELEDELKNAKRRIEELKRERDAESKTVAAMIEHVDDERAIREQGRDAFDMELNDKGEWCWGPGVKRL